MMRAKSDASVVELADRRDGDWVTVGGMITQSKKVKTRKGDFMSFVTLSDTEASVECIVFGKVMEATGDALEIDSIVLIRGKVEHKDRGATSLVAQQIERFEPTPEEIQRAQHRATRAAPSRPVLRLHLDATVLPASALGRLRDLLTGFPGECDVIVELTTSAGRRRLKLGSGYRVVRSAALSAELDLLFGAALVTGTAAAAADQSDEADPPSRAVA